MSDNEPVGHDHDYLSTKGAGTPARDPLSGMTGLFGSTEPEAFADAVTEAVRAPSLPVRGDWPCQQDPMEDPPPRLLAALYLFLRDGSPGDVEQKMLNVASLEPTDFTNGYLEDYARSLCTYLLEEPPLVHSGQPVVDPAGESVCDDPHCPVCGVP